MATLTWNARGQLIIGGQPRILRGIYDAGFAGASGTDMAGHVTARQYSRYRLNFVNHVQTGTLNNGGRLADAIAPLGMYCTAIGNFFANFTFDPDFFSPSTSSFDILANPSYSGTPFRTSFPAHPNSFGIYSADEPQISPSGWFETGNVSAGVPYNRLNNPTFTNLTGWTTTVNGGGSGSVAAVAGRAQLIGGTSASVDLSQLTPRPLTLGVPYKFAFTLQASSAVRVRLTSGATTYVDEVLTGASGSAGTPYWRAFTPTTTTVTATFTVLTGVTGNVDNTYITKADWEGDPPPVPSTRGLDATIALYNYYKAQAPTMPVFAAFINDSPYQWIDWSPRPIGHVVGNDIYTIGQAPEQDPDNAGILDNTYGYMNFAVGEATALARYYCLLYNADGTLGGGTVGGGSVRVPVVVLQLQKFGSTSRFQTVPEQVSHLAAAMTELRGSGGVIWWALGNQNAGLDHTAATSFVGNGTQTVFQTSQLVAEEAVDVEVRVGGVVQSQSLYTIQNLGDRSLTRVGNFWNFTNPCQVTFNTPPANGASITITVNTWPATKRNAAKQFLEDATTMLETYESTLVQAPSETLVTNNSTWEADFKTWRIGHTNLLRQNPVGHDQPCWIFAGTQRYQDEFDRLNLASPDFTLSQHMMTPNQKGDVRYCAWVAPTYALVSVYNLHPNPRPFTLTLAQAGIRCEVLLEGRDVVLTGGGTVLSDTCGGSSSLRQGSFGQGHIYKIYFGAAGINGYDLWANPALTSLTELFDDAIPVGGSFAMLSGGRQSAGSVGATEVAHENFRVAFKKIALQGTPTNEYDAWANPSLDAPTELFDDAVSAGVGGSFAMLIGGKDSAGVVGPTDVTHGNFRVAFKKIALEGAPTTAPRSQHRTDWVLR